MSRLGNRGDTIVEVLICMAIVSSALGTAYASTRQSLLKTQQTQERGEATKLTEQQLERLRLASEQPNSPLFTAPGFNSPSTSCLDASGIPTTACTFGLNGRFTILITRTTTGTQHVFTVSAHWERAGGGGTHRINMYYRVHPIVMHDEYQLRTIA